MSQLYPSANATKLSNARLTIWAWFWAGADFGPGWKPKTWDVYPMWALNDVNGPEPTEDPLGINATRQKIFMHGTTEEQQLAMGEVSEKYLALK